MWKILLFIIFVNITNNIQAAPLSDFQGKAGHKDRSQMIEKSLEAFLDLYYEENLSHSNNEIPNSSVKDSEMNVLLKNDNEKLPKTTSHDIYDQMQSDQPSFGDLVAPNNHSDEAYMEAARLRAKNLWKDMLMKKTLTMVGRFNSTISNKSELDLINITQLLNKIHNVTNATEDNYLTEKIRSFYPSCEMPKNTDHELWKDLNTTMNLYFNFDQLEGDIAMATLRLYRLPQNGTNVNANSLENCQSEEEKMQRVSIFWYTKSLKRQNKIKKRLSDSKMIMESSKWVELSVLPAAKAWVKGRNLGLAIQVEDQDGVTLKTHQFFKGASCMVGMSTPKPIPTIIRDTFESHEHDEDSDSPRGNQAPADHHNPSLLPTIDLCTLDKSVQGYTCNLHKMHEANIAQELQQSTHRHRHRHHVPLPQPSPLINDFRSQIVSKQIIIPSNGNAQLASAQFRNFNFDLFNRTRTKR